MEKGLIDEVRELHRNGMTYERMDELGLEYRYISRHLTGELREEKMLEELETKIKQFAKRQMTWLKRDKEIHWFRSADTEKIFATIKGFLEN
jgi:tRNA dimethylallyltransferase